MVGIITCSVVSLLVWIRYAMALILGMKYHFTHPSFAIHIFASELAHHVDRQNQEEEKQGARWPSSQ